MDNSSALAPVIAACSNAVRLLWAADDISLPALFDSSVTVVSEGSPELLAAPNCICGIHEMLDSVERAARTWLDNACARFKDEDYRAIPLGNDHCAITAQYTAIVSWSEAAGTLERRFAVTATSVWRRVSDDAWVAVLWHDSRREVKSNDAADTQAETWPEAEDDLLQPIYGPRVMLEAHDENDTVYWVAPTNVMWIAANGTETLVQCVDQQICLHVAFDEVFDLLVAGGVPLVQTGEGRATNPNVSQGLQP